MAVAIVTYRLKSIMLLSLPISYSFQKFFLKSPIIPEIIPTKITLLTKLASTNYITTNS